jgi:hypothetical protein
MKICYITQNIASLCKIRKIGEREREREREIRCDSVRYNFCGGTNTEEVFLLTEVQSPEAL